MEQKIIHYISLVCLIGMIIFLQCGTVAADEKCYVPDGDGAAFNPDSGVFDKDNKWFYAGKYQRWTWAGTSTWLVVNDFDKEILIIDGYASKATLGTGDEDDYAEDYHLSRLTRFANVIRGFCSLGYKLVGIIISHNHLDHTMDLGTLYFLLNAPEGVNITDNEDEDEDDRAVSQVPTQYSPAIFSVDFKVVASWNTADHPTHAEGFSNKYLLNHYLLFKDENDNYIQKDISCASVNAVCAQRCDTDVEFSKEADLYRKIPDSDDELVTVECDNPNLSICNDEDASIALGHFAIQVVLWPHWDVPLGGAFHPGHGWVISLNIWHSEAPDARRVFITTSSGDNPEDIPQDVKISTDHLIYAWPYYALDSARRKIAETAKNNIEFFDDRGQEPAFIFVNHYDDNGPIDNELDETEDKSDRYSGVVSHDASDSLYQFLLEEEAVVSCPEPWSSAECWIGMTDRWLRWGAYVSEVLGMSSMNGGESWWASRTEGVYDNDCDGYVDNDDNCPEVANADQADADNDGTGDACDTCTDTDGDRYGNPGFPANNCIVDNCPDTVNPDQLDTDNDGIGDACDTCTDTDGDGYGNPGYPGNTCDDDNCPDAANADQADWDSDGLGDVCDDDVDGDGLLNENDECEFTAVGVVVDPSTGCSIEQLVPCEGPRGTTEAWKNHGEYISALAHITNSFMKDGLITEEEKEAIMAEGASSDCGK